jgi:hypothetical protein
MPMNKIFCPKGIVSRDDSYLSVFSVSVLWFHYDIQEGKYPIKRRWQLVMRIDFCGCFGVFNAQIAPQEEGYKN